ncbi:SAM-dependent methyltransferase [Streptomyces iconiensis]|uniref:SAM-dependent methyltransferase n=1 Tax=Streptomyces iconiensis TaxID=1384038 RepID=A0ABT6ZZH7_9ACTN|nr:SAM-dependent methyltransferase [Streptomyces iconiensis]MDJ1134479.1 SAM-dependent methyltransferase [Streptomyces iconiensis]
MTDSPDRADTGERIDTTVAHSARIWDYWTGGKDHYEADRLAGDKVQDVFPGMTTLARVGRHFIGRTVRYLAGEAGIRQFLDIGTGLPTVDNTHEVAQRVAPGSRIVYVDNDPLVLAHAHALLTSTREGATRYVEADVRQPEKILEAAAPTLDLDKPVAVMLMGILAHVSDYDEARAIVRRLMRDLPPGSHLAVRDGTNTDPLYVKALEGYNRSGAVPYVPRSPEQVAGFLDGLELVEPGVVSCPQWRPEAPEVGPRKEVSLYGGVGRKLAGGPLLGEFGRTK